MFNYDSFKLFILKVTLGVIFILLSFFLFLSLITYSPDDPGIGKLFDEQEISNVFGFFGAITSSIFYAVFGTPSLIISIYLLYVGIILALGVIKTRLLIKFWAIIFSSIFIDFFGLIYKIQFIETGFLSFFLYNNLLYYVTDLTKNFFYKNSIGLLLFSFSILFLFFSFSIKIRFLQSSYKNIFGVLFFVITKPLKLIGYFFKKKETEEALRNKRRNEPTITKSPKRHSEIIKKDKKLNGLLKSENAFIFNLPERHYLLKSKTKTADKKEIENLNKKNSQKLEQVLGEYGVDGKVTGFKTGPIVTLYEFIPNAGIKASKVIGLSDDIARAMSSISARISSQPGKTSLGIEIPNVKRENVLFGDLINKPRFLELNNRLTLALGKDISGEEVYADLERMPHLLIAGTTGSGKSVGINTIIMSILYRFKPDECKLMLIDPKMLELSIYENIPHLLTPVVTNPNKAVFALKWVVREMENRYKLMSTINVKNINSYNEKSKKILSSGKKLYREVQTGIDNETRQPILERREIILEKMPFIVVVIDEMADLMMVAGKEVENLVQRLAQMARASGIHLVTATQRPSVDVITGTIKANFPSRLSYKVASKFDSRTILNEMGAEQLLGSGDMLFLENGTNLKRLHGGFISETEIERVVNGIKEQAIFDPKNEISIDEKKEEGSLAFSFDDGEVDTLYSKAVDLIISQQKVSTSYIQRYLQIGYNRAARIVEKMEEEGIISEANNAGKRQVLRKK